MCRNCSRAAYISVTPPGWSYVVLAMISSLLLLQRRPCAVKEKLNDSAHGLFRDCPRDQPAPLAVVQIVTQHLDAPRLALCAALGALDLMLSLVDEVEHKRLDRCAVAQTDKPQHKRHSAHNNEHQRQPRGQRGKNSVENGFHLLLLSVANWQGFGSIVQFRTGAIAAQCVIALVKIFEVFQAAGVDAALFDVKGAGLIQPVVHDGKKSFFHGLALFFLRLDALRQATIGSSQNAGHASKNEFSDVFQNKLPHGLIPPGAGQAPFLR
nr:MAG TPA: hypothetical protein [Caudoviricetes sp.]